MYTNGLKDRFGSPLVSQKDVEQQIVEPLEAINGRLTTTEENLSKVSEDLETTKEEIVTEIREDLNTKADLVLDNTFSGQNVFTNTITLNSVDGSSNTTISSEGIITPNLTTFSINNNDLTFNDTEIVIGDKVLTFDGEDEIIPANSVTDEARVFARVAQESATVAEASMETAVASASAASISETNAANSATSAEANAALLGDAALQGGDNTFSGTNTLTGSIKLANQNAREAGDFVFMQGAIMAWLVEGYSWTYEATKRDFGGLNEFAFPDDLPFPACYDVATLPYALRLQNVKLTKLPDSWLFDKAEGTTDGYHRWHWFFPATLKELPENMTLDNLKTANDIFADTKITQVPAGMTLKKCTEVKGAFARTKITSIPEGMTFDNAVDVSNVFTGTKIKRLPAGMTLPKATNIGAFCASCSELEELPEGFNPPATTAAEAFLRCKKLTRLPDSFTLSECTTAGACFRETIFTTLPEGMTLEKLQDAGSAYHEGMFMNSQIRTLPAALNLMSLSNGKKMFYGCQLDRDSALRVLTTIPAHTSGDHPLTIGIHVDHQADEELLAAIDAATDKGWTVTIQWNGTATSSTFALRPTPTPPVYTKCVQNEYGLYVDATNARYSVEWGHIITSPDGKSPEELGYQQFNSLEEALNQWGLTEYIEIPNEEQNNN